ncbi:hypothetical protein D3C80_521250 [compost metagenome]
MNLDNIRFTNSSINQRLGELGFNDVIFNKFLKEWAVVGVIVQRNGDGVMTNQTLGERDFRGGSHQRSLRDMDYLILPGHQSSLHLSSRL